MKKREKKMETPLLTTYEPEYSTDCGIQTQLVNLRYIPTHIHVDSLEFIYCLKGEVYANVCHEYCHIPAGHLVTVDQEDVRNILAYEDNLTLIIHISLQHPSFDREELRNTLFSCASILATGNLKPHIEKVYNKLIASAITADTNKLAQLHASILCLMVDKFSWFSVLDMSDKNDKKYRERLLKIIDCIKENCCEKTTISQMASVLFLNPDYLSSFIRRTSFSSYTKLIAFYRCLNAQKFLLETELPVSQIATRSGLSSEKYLYKYFKFWWQYSPLQYRKKFQEYASIPEEYTEYSDEQVLELLKEYIIDHFVTDASVLNTQTAY